MTNKKKGNTKVTVYPAWCKGCGLCVEFCPGNVLALNKEGKAEVVQEAECTNCGFCEYHCPDFAIAITPKREKKPAQENQTSASDSDKSDKPEELSQEKAQKSSDVESVSSSK